MTIKIRIQNYYKLVKMRRNVFRLLVMLVLLANARLLVLYIKHSDGEKRISVAENPVEYDPELPYQYPEEVDLRVIVMTYNRASSLEKLLQSVDQLQMDGDRGYLEIWIDRKRIPDPEHGTLHNVDAEEGWSREVGPEDKVDAETLRIARTFAWSGGPTRVHVHRKSVGICVQWIETWRPRVGSRELALYLEDDLSVSPFAYRWLKAIHAKYGSRTDVAGYTLQSESVNLATGAGPLRRPRHQVVFFYKLLGSWGFAPHPVAWSEFQDWYHDVRNDDKFRPYVARASLITKWYRMFEKRNRQETMWTIWHVYYSDKRNLFTVYNNIGVGARGDDVLLAVNRMEPGLHFQNKGAESTEKLLRFWSDDYIKLPELPLIYDFDGKLAHK